MGIWDGVRGTCCAVSALTVVGRCCRDKGTKPKKLAAVVDAAGCTDGYPYLFTRTCAHLALRLVNARTRVHLARLGVFERYDIR